MRAMLDELMGKERNVPLDQRKGTDIKFNDPEVCKYALAGLCPYGLFKNTKSDLGEYFRNMHWTWGSLRYVMFVGFCRICTGVAVYQC